MQASFPCRKGNFHISKLVKICFQSPPCRQTHLLLLSPSLPAPLSLCEGVSVEHSPEPFSSCLPGPRQPLDPLPCGVRDAMVGLSAVQYDVCASYNSKTEAQVETGAQLGAELLAVLL